MDRAPAVSRRAPDVSVLTPFTQADRGYLLDAYASFAHSQIRWEWVLQEDGGDPAGPPAPVRDDPRVSYEANCLRLGAAGTRNMALARAAGEHVVLLDADDMLAPGALENFAAAADKDVFWVFGQGVLWDPDGGKAVLERSVLESRRYAAGELLGFARALGHLPLYSTPGMYRRSVLLALGGWPAMPREEDVSVQLRAVTRFPGVVMAAETHIVRDHPGRTVRDPALSDLPSRCRRLVVHSLGEDPAVWADFIGCSASSDLYARSVYGEVAVARLCGRCGKVHNGRYCRYCGELAV
jgi:hypothetical protein